MKILLIGVCTRCDCHFSGSGCPNCDQDSGSRILNPIACYVFANGMVMTFGPDGQQIPELQGHKSDVLETIQKFFPDCNIERATWTPLSRIVQ